MNTVKFIHSLHRPFNQPLKAVRWVCIFINSRKTSVSSSLLNIEFYLYLIGNLNREFKQHSLSEYNGIPSKESIVEITNYISGLTKKQKIDLIQKSLKGERELAIEKQVYSTYKAASYFMNMAKDKFFLIDSKNRLTEDGKELLSIRAGFFSYSEAEKLFYFKKILDCDFHLFISLCYFIKLSFKYDYKDYIGLQFEFLDKFYQIRHFNFTSQSLDNYNTVRSFWIQILGVLDSRKIIRQKYLKIIFENPLFKLLNEDIVSQISVYEKTYFKPQKILFTNKNKFLTIYNKRVKNGNEELGFVNLYDIKEDMRLSFESFESLVNKFYEQEKGKKHIFFSNIVSSIDRRKRFNVRGISVLKVKIK